MKSEYSATHVLPAQGAYLRTIRIAQIGETGNRRAMTLRQQESGTGGEGTRTMTTVKEPVSQTSLAPSTKVTAGGTAGAVTVLVMYILDRLPWLPCLPTSDRPVTVLFTFLSGYIVKERRSHAHSNGCTQQLSHRTRSAAAAGVVPRRRRSVGATRSDAPRAFFFSDEGGESRGGRADHSALILHPARDQKFEYSVTQGPNWPQRHTDADPVSNRGGGWAVDETTFAGRRAKPPHSDACNGGLIWNHGRLRHAQ